MDFRSTVAEKRPVFVFGTAPPKKETPQERLYEIGEKLASRFRGISVDAFGVYDIQDENGRNGAERPYPFIPTEDPRKYARILGERAGTEAITYSSVVHIPRAGFEEWLQETAALYRQRNLALVGGSSQTSYPGPSVTEAADIASSNGNYFFLGGITIPERHSQRRDEHRRIREKGYHGMEFFTSQIIYNPVNAAQLLRDYDRLCRESGARPARILLNFSLFGTEKMASFLRWLGVDLPAEAEQKVLSAEDPLKKSGEICRDNLRYILDAAHECDVPLGLSVESVSKVRREIDASVELFSVLKEEMEKFYM